MKKISCQKGRKIYISALLLFAYTLCAFPLHAQSPGGVSTTGLKLWIKADQGVSASGAVPTAWADQGPANNDLVSFGGTGMSYITIGQNFNPTINFPGGPGAGNAFRKLTGILSGGPYTSATAFTVSNTTAAANVTAWSEALGTGGSFNLFVPYGDNINYSDVPSAARISIAAPANTLNQFNVWTQNSVSGSQLFQQNGRNIVTGTSAAVTYNGNGSAFNLGFNTGNTIVYNGKISEVVIYSQALSAIQRLNIQSYLAIKWGVSLDQTAATNYQASDSNVIWNATTNTAYKFRVTGIGRDDAGSLDQRQSRNQDISSPGYVTMGLGTIAASNAANTNAFTANKSYLVWGDDNVAGVTSSTVTGDGTITLPVSACNVYTRMGKTYKVQETGTVGGVQVQVNVKSLALGTTASDFYLAINNSSTFTGTITKLVQASSYTNGVVTFNNVDFADGDFFTVIGQKSNGPAGVTAGLGLWLRADAGINLNGTTVSQWDDQSIYAKNAIQATVANQATYQAGNSINFNPALKFTTTQNYTVPSLFTATGTGNFKVFTTGTVDGLGNNAVSSGMFSELTANTYDVAFTPYHSNGNFYFDGPYGYRNFGPHGVTLGKTNLYTLTRAATSLFATNARKLLTTATAIGGSVAGNNSVFHIGAWSGQDWYNGKIGELIVFNNAAAMTANQQLAIESYLSLKWGASLDQTVATNYLSSDESVIWNGTANATYKNRVTGIGRDDCGGLNQKQSRNQDIASPGYVTMGLGTIAASNAANTNSFAATKSYEIWGDDGVAGTSITSGASDGTITLPPNICNLYNRMGKTFKVQETGTVGAVQVQVNISGLALGKTATDFYLAINTSAVFTGTITRLVQATSYSSNVLTFDNVDFTDGDFFTVIGQKAEGPGGVAGGLRLWVQADAGLTISGTYATQWDDQSINGNNLTASNVNNTYSASGLNYNPVITTPGATTGSYFYKVGGIFKAAAYSGATAFSVVKPEANVQSSLFYEALVSGSYNTHIPWTDGIIYSDIPSTSRISIAAPATALSQANLWTSTSTSGAQTLKQNGKNIQTGTSAAVNYTGNNSNFYLSAYAGNPAQWGGDISEVALYSQPLSPADLQKVQSYFALKWGLTIDQTAATDYIASDGTTKMWTAATGAAFKYNIAGIGRDDCGGIYQKQSHSVNNALQPALGIDSIAASNAENAGTFTNMNFQSWADNNGALTQSGVAVPAGFTVTNWLTRKWQVQETGTVGTLQLSAPAAMLTGLGAGGGAFLMVADDAAFTVNTQEIPMSLADGNWTANFDFNGVKYFTFGKKSVPEICDNGIDDDLNGLTDGLDPACGAGNITCASGNLLSNPSFELPLATNGNGANNIVASIPNWINRSTSNTTVNVVKPDGVYTGGPSNASDGDQYIDLQGATGIMDQNFTISTPAVLSFSGQFSNRGSALPAYVGGNAFIQILDIRGEQVAISNTVALDASLGNNTWLTATGLTSLLPAGTYTFRFVARSDYAHYDNMHLCIIDNAARNCTNRVVLKPEPAWSATASGTFGGLSPANAIDSKFTDAAGVYNLWATATTNTAGQYITFDYGAPKDLVGFVYWPRTLGTQDINRYTVKYSNDGINFTTIQTGSLRRQAIFEVYNNDPANYPERYVGDPIEVNFSSGVTARYLRLVVNSTYAAGYAAILEMLPIVCGSGPVLPDISCANANLLNTATNSTGTGLAPIDKFDPHWEVTWVPNNTAATNVTVANNTFVPAISTGNSVPGAWANSPFGNANWIGYTPTSYDANVDGYGDGASQNDYFWRYRFNITDAYLLPAFKLTLNFLSDNQTRNIYINGTGQAPQFGLPGGGFNIANQTQTSLKNGWQLGQNEVLVHVNSQPGYAGFLGQNVTSCPGLDFGDAPASYNVTRTTFGAGHIMETNSGGNITLRLGALVDAEADGIASANALHDNQTGQNDEDGIASFPVIAGGYVHNITNYSVNVSVRNITGATANLCGWIDWDNNGTFDAGEAVCVTVPNGATSATLLWPSATLGGGGGSLGVYARFRMTTDVLNSGTPNGAASNGEVEDYFIPFATPLPLDLLSFTAVKKDNTALLTWVTANEQNTDQFIIERSNDGSSWNTIGTVRAAGNSTSQKTYTYTDAQPLNGMNYYRLRMVDLDANSKLSDIRKLLFTGLNNSVTIAPNPSMGPTTLYFSQPLTGNASVRVFNSVGQLILTYTLPAGTSKYDMNPGALAKGIYVVSVDGPGLNSKLKLMIK